MKKKTFIVQLLDSKKPNRKSFTQVEDANFYSNDTDASLVFIPHEDTFDFGSAKVVMYNRGDESLVERDMVVAIENGRKVASYELPEEIIAHWGDWTAQPVFINGGEIYSGSIVPFSVFRYLMHDRPPRLNEVVTITNFIQQSQALVDDMAQKETQRVTQEQARQSAEEFRVQAESERSVKYESYAQQFNDVITDLSEEKDYHSLPEISAARGGHDTLGQRLDETTAQLEQTEQEVFRKRELEDLSPTVLSAIEGGEGTSFNLLSIPQDKSVTPKKTSFIKTERLSVNQVNPDNIIYGHTANSNTGELVENSSYNIVWVGDVKPNTLYSVPYTTNFYEYDENGDFLKYIQAGSVTTSPQTKGMYVRIIASSSVPMYVNEGDNKVYEPYREKQSFVGLDSLNMTDNMLNQVLTAYPEIADAKVINDELYSVRHPYRMDTENSTGNRYWSQSGGVATQVPLTNYYSLNDLIDVEPDQVLRLYHWGAINGDTQLAYSAYKSDNTPYNGSNSRINFSTGVYDADTDSYTFTIPDGTYKVGLSMQVSADHDYRDGYAVVGSSFVSFTPTMQTLIGEEVAKKTGDIDIKNDVTAEMFQKGSSPKTLSKKIGIISAGQSNIDGRVPESELPSYLTLPLEGVNYASNYTTGGRDGVFQTSIKRTDLSSIRWGFDLVTYYNIAQQLGEDFYVMKWSQGATSIDPTGTSDNHWTPFYEELESMDNSLLYSFESLIRACTQAQGEQFDIGAMIWHQGEGDNYRQSVTASEKYYDNLRYLIAYCRGIVGNSRLPFITGTISHKSAQYDPTIEKAMIRIADEDPYVYLVDMKNADLRDAYHFNAEWNEYLGQKVFDCLIDAGVINATKLNPSEPTPS